MKKRKIKNWSQAVTALGGPLALGTALNRSPSSVCLWRKRGVPHKLRHIVVSKLIAKGYTIEGSVGPGIPPSVYTAMKILDKE